MSSLLISKNKAFELLLMLVLDVFIFFILGIDGVVLFSLGFVWNWVGSQDLGPLFEHKRYRFSTLKTVYNFQNLIQKPFPTAPFAAKVILRALPAGIFWNSVIWFFDSHLPGWCIFVGSLSLEVIVLRPKAKESIP